MPNMSKDVARKVYEILVREAGAYPNDISDFMTSQSTDTPQEWRFQGLLGFGGKFRVNHGNQPCPWFIDCYREQGNKKTSKIVATVNEQLSALYNDVVTGKFKPENDEKPVTTWRQPRNTNLSVPSTDSNLGANLRELRKPKKREGW